MHSLSAYYRDTARAAKMVLRGEWASPPLCNEYEGNVLALEGWIDILEKPSVADGRQSTAHMIVDLAAPIYSDKVSRMSSKVKISSNGPDKVLYEVVKKDIDITGVHLNL